MKTLTEIIDPEAARWVEAMKAAGHSPLLDEEDGEIDMFGMSYEFCNGPVCVLCHRSWCHHCTSPDKIEPCDANVIEGELAVKLIEDKTNG